MADNRVAANRQAEFYNFSLSDINVNIVDWNLQETEFT